MLCVGGCFLNVMLFVHALGGVFYLFGLWGGLGILSLSFTGLITLDHVIGGETIRRQNIGLEPAQYCHGGPK